MVVIADDMFSVQDSHCWQLSKEKDEWQLCRLTCDQCTAETYPNFASMNYPYDCWQL